MPSPLRTEIYTPPEFFENFSALPKDVQKQVVEALPVLDDYKWDGTLPLVEDPPASWHFTYALPSGWVLRIYVDFDRTGPGVPIKRRVTLLGCFPS